MTTRTGFASAGVVAAAIALSWLLFVGLPRWYDDRPAPAAAGSAATAVTEPGRKIKANLFYLSEDGRSLKSVEQEVPFGETPTDQAKAIVAAQIAPPAAPFVTAIPPGTTLRAVFVTDRGDAFVDLSAELASAHPGGSMNELLTIYTIVHALTINLPAIGTVQLLINGKEVETLAGHVELTHPFVKNLAWVQ